MSFLYFSGLMKVITASSKRCNKVCELFQQCMSEYRAGVGVAFPWHVYHFKYDGKRSATETNSASHHTPLGSLWLYKLPLPTLLNHSHYLDLQLRHILLNYPKVNLRVTIQYFTEWLTASYALVNLVLRSCPAFCHLQFLFFM